MKRWMHAWMNCSSWKRVKREEERKDFCFSLFLLQLSYFTYVHQKHERTLSVNMLCGGRKTMPTSPEPEAYPPLSHTTQQLYGALLLRASIL